MKKKRFLITIIFVAFTNLVQATLIISNTGGRRDEIFESIKRISHEDLTMDHNGVVSYPTHWYDFFISASRGRRLICRLVDSHHTIEIVDTQYNSETEFADCQGAAIASITNGRINRGPGSNTIVRINLERRHEALVFNFGGLAPNTIGFEHPTVDSVLAHELIHALHAAYGLGISQETTSFSNTNPVHVPNSWVGIGILGYYTATEIVDMEEAVTVGLSHARIAADTDYPGYSSDPLTDITENAIRLELGEYIRGMYSTRSALRIPESQYYVAGGWIELGVREMDVTQGFCDRGPNRSLSLSKNKLLVSKDIPELSVYPSPAHNDLFLKGHYGIDKIEVYNTSGQSFDLNISHDQVDVSGLLPGAYLIKFTTKSGKVKTKTFIKK